MDLDSGSESAAMIHASRRGVVLPIALLLVLALGALAGSVLALARTELLLERGNLRYLERRAADEGELRALAEASADQPVPGRTSLASGFVLLRSTEDGPAAMAVAFDFDPDSVAASLPALEVGHSPPAGAVRWAGEDCEAPAEGPSMPLVRVRPSDMSVIPDPPLPGPPRLGILGPNQLLMLGAVSLAQAGELPGGEEARILAAPEGARYWSGEASGLLVATGDLALEGDAVFRGVVLAAGDLWVAGTARIEGAALAGGTARILEGGSILGCSAWVVRALEQDGLMGAHPVPPARILGRF